MSWSTQDRAAKALSKINSSNTTSAAGAGRIVLPRLERLPDSYAFPPRDSLVHLLLVRIARSLGFYLRFGGEVLGLLPGRYKRLLLSYVAVYGGVTAAEREWIMDFIVGVMDEEVSDEMSGASGQAVDGAVRSAPEKAGDWEDEVEQGDYTFDEGEPLGMERIDLTHALGDWMSMKRLKRYLVDAALSQLPSTLSDQESNEQSANTSPVNRRVGDITTATAALSIAPSPTLRFYTSLKHLSLAHPQTSDWKGLLSASTYLTTLTHLSLAYWPIPTQTPQSLTNNTRIKHPMLQNVSMAWGGTDMYSVFENDWSESAGLLKRLSRNLICLEWIDFEGCGEWTNALIHEDGPEWNGGWRGINFIRLGVGWIPESEVVSILSKSRLGGNNTSAGKTTKKTPFVFDPKSDLAMQNYEYRQLKDRLRQTADKIRAIRRARKGGWIEFEIEDEESVFLKRARDWEGIVRGGLAGDDDDDQMREEGGISE